MPSLQSFFAKHPNRSDAMAAYVWIESTLSLEVAAALLTQATGLPFKERGDFNEAPSPT